LGNGTVGGSTFIPGQVNGLSGITAIAGDCTAHALALKNDGTVWSWGRNYEGELGNGGGASTNVPVQAGTPTGIIAIAGGNYHSMALRMMARFTPGVTTNTGNWETVPTFLRGYLLRYLGFPGS
jgi:alpha-tubulin suppressor-like RCC1 family protein